MTKVRLEPLVVRTAEARRDWAIRKAKALATRRIELDQGAPRATGLLLVDAVARYFEGHKQLRASTLKGYRRVAEKFLEWAERERISKTEDLTRAKLMAFRESIIAEPKHEAAAKTKRGGKIKTAQPRSGHSVNRELRSIRVVLGYLSELDLLPRLSFDDLRRALKRLPVSVERLAFLKPAELGQLLDAALAHDAELYAETRAEHRGAKPTGSTARYTAVAPFVAFVLLTGMRLSEALELDWSQVDLTATNNEGEPSGEIHLTGATKTKRARTVGLEVSSSARELVEALKSSASVTGRVFSSLTTDLVVAAGKRLKADYGAPKAFGWQALRRTCGTYLTNAAGIFGAASAYRSAKQLGHSVVVSERHYAGVARGIPREARTLEAAMGIEDQMARIIAAATVRKATK